MNRHELSIAMVGTRGVPARYGGFETAVEEVGSRLAARGHRVRVYTRTPAGEQPAPASYLGMEVVTLPAARKRSLETLSHTALSVGHLVARRTDVAFVFNAANAPLLPVLRAARIPTATHVDGLEWKRAKWGPGGQRYYRAAETAAVRWSDAIIADARGIQDYYDREYGISSTLIAYGAPLVDGTGAGLDGLGLEPGGYHLVVARFEPENHVLEIVEGYTRSAARRPLVVVGSAPYAHDYTERIARIAEADDRIRLLGGVWDQDLLDNLYAGATTYLHGHSVGGTNPSLLRALGAGAPVVAFDVDFNREVVREAGLYFRTPDDVAAQVELAEADPEATRQRGKQNRERALDYSWDEVADGYERLARDLAARRTPGPQRRARRRPAAPEPAPATADGGSGPGRTVLFDGAWWRRGPISNRSVQRALVTEWCRLWPQDDVVVAVPRRDAAAVDDLPVGARLETTRLWPHGLSNLFELGRIARRVGATSVVAHNFTPLYGPRATTFVHDAIFTDHPEWFSRDERLYFSLMLPSSRRSRGVVTSSATEAARLGRRTSRPVSAVGLGLPPALATAEPRRPERLGDVASFALSVGRLNVRKNLAQVLAALPHSDRVGPGSPLVVVGGTDHSGVIPGLSPEAEELVRSGAVVLLGQVDDAELAWLYRNAAVTTFLSRDEGFGLPVIEALTAGSSLVLSDIAVFRELADGAARFVPLDAEPAVTAAALDAAWDEPVPAELRAELAQRYSWEAVTRGLAQAVGR